MIGAPVYFRLIFHLILMIFHFQTISIVLKMRDIMEFAYSITLPVYDGFTKFVMWPSVISVIITIYNILYA